VYVLSDALLCDQVSKCLLKSEAEENSAHLCFPP
jgi:hypothetical protein